MDSAAGYPLLLEFGWVTQPLRLNSRSPTQVDFLDVVRLLDVVPVRSVALNLHCGGNLLTMVTHTSSLL